MRDVLWALEGLVCDSANLPGPEASPDGRPGPITNRPAAEGILRVSLRRAAR
jgi:hypothetical protein